MWQYKCPNSLYLSFGLAVVVVVAVAADIAFVVVGNPAAVDSPGGGDLVEEVRSSRGMAAGTEVVGCNSPGSTWL